jgi:hypothetical protein
MRCAYLCPPLIENATLLFGPISPDAAPDEWRRENPPQAQRMASEIVELGRKPKRKRKEDEELTRRPRQGHNEVFLSD